jgi:hypothetical protein
MYASRLEWYQHELEEHRQEWFCNTAGHSSYQSEHHFKNHMVEEHAAGMFLKAFNTILHATKRSLLFLRFLDDTIMMVDRMLILSHQDTA